MVPRVQKIFEVEKFFFRRHNKILVSFGPVNPKLLRKQISASLNYSLPLSLSATLSLSWPVDDSVQTTTKASRSSPYATILGEIERNPVHRARLRACSDMRWFPLHRQQDPLCSRRDTSRSAIAIDSLAVCVIIQPYSICIWVFCVLIR